MTFFYTTSQILTNPSIEPQGKYSSFIGFFLLIDHLNVILGLRKTISDVSMQSHSDIFVAPRQITREKGTNRNTFQLSISACFFLYSFTKPSKTFFSPSAFVCNAGTTSATVRSTNTPLINRKHFRSLGIGPSVSNTSLLSSSCQYAFIAALFFLF
jgi:hypothetical protein